VFGGDHEVMADTDEKFFAARILDVVDLLYSQVGLCAPPWITIYNEIIV